MYITEWDLGDSEEWPQAAWNEGPAAGLRNEVRQVEKRIDKLTVVSIAPIIAAALQAVFEDESVSEIFHGENMP